MPVPQLKTYAQKSGKSLSEVESYWEEAKSQAEKKFKHGSPRFWAYVSGIVKRRCGIKESLTFTSYMLTELLDTDMTIKDSDIHENHPDLVSIRKMIDGHEMEFYATEWKGGWDIEFSELKEVDGRTHADYSMTNHGNAPKVLSFVIASLKKLIELKNPTKVYFSAKKSDRSRAAVYERMIKKYFKDWEFEKKDKEDIAVYFTLTKKK